MNVKNYSNAEQMEIWKHTYIHNWSLEPFNQNYDIVSHTTYVVCINFYT